MAAGMSLQEYGLNELTTSASQRTPSELIAEVERRMRREGPPSLTLPHEGEGI